MAVVFTDPKSLITPSFRLLSQRECLANGNILPTPEGGSRLVENGEFEGHCEIEN
jgi:hypothetical protein